MNESTNTMNATATQLSNRILAGAKELAQLGQSLSEEQWNTPVLVDGRSIGLVIHHVASCYPIEIDLAKVLAAGEPITGATKAAIDQMNAEHADAHRSAGKEETLALLERNSKVAAEAVSQLTEEELQNSNTVSLNANAPLTCQFFIEDHALRHSFHHMAKIKETLGM